MKLSEKIQEALREQQEINLSDPAVQKRLAAQWGYVPAGAQPAPSVPEGWLHHAARMATLARKLREPDWCLESIREMQRELRTLEEAALAAAPGEAT